KHGAPLPLPCELCHVWHKRLDHHLNDVHGKDVSRDQKFKIMSEMRTKYWHKDDESDEEDIGENIQNQFVARSRNHKLDNLPSSSTTHPLPSDFIPPNATRITPAMAKDFNISLEDYFTIVYFDVDHLLKAFENDLMSGNLGESSAKNH
uniref:Uncharacterized protein n=2 Tax=Clytia hemisphaerica TaxID=252671 RepID=A0A7M5XLW8_9CNID